MSKRKPMTLEQAVRMLEEEYERAQKLQYVRNPLAWALHRVWKVADRGGSADED